VAEEKSHGGRGAHGSEYSFASLPVFNNYVNYGINPNPSSLGTNDVSFFGPPTGTEWGAQASYTITPAIEAVTSFCKRETRARS
jgi:hypothetical protein